MRAAITLRVRLRIFLVVTAALCALAALFTIGGFRQRDDALAESRTLNDARMSALALGSAMAIQQSAVNGYVVTGNSRFLSPYFQAHAQAELALADLERLLADHPGLASDVQLVASTAARWRAISAEPRLAAVDQGDLARAQRLTKTAHDVELGELVRQRTRQAVDEITAARLAAVQRYDQARERLTAIVWTILAALVAVAVLGAIALHRWVMRPLAVLGRSVDHLAAGNLDQPVTSTGPPEVRALADQVDRTRQRLHTEASALLASNQSLAEAQQRLAQVMDALTDVGFVSLDPSGVITGWSAGSERITGLPPERAIGRSIAELGPPEGAEQLTETLKQVVRSGSMEFIRLWEGRPDRPPIWTSTVLAPMRNEDGLLTGFSMMNRDITAAKAADDALRDAHEQLAARAEQLQLLNTQLTESHRELEAFTYTVSHDLRAPLRAINGFARLLHEEHRAELSAEAQRYLELVQVNAQRMGLLIDDLLVFARLLRAPMHRVPTPLGQAVLAAWREVADPGAKAQLEVGELPTVSADPGLLHQALTHLLGNAVKFSRDTPQPLVRVDAAPDPERTGQLAITVRDNGVGFDPRYGAQLFGMFHRQHPEYEGTGVGLAIVQRVVQRHGGRVWASSHPGEGAAFSFTLGPQVLGGGPGGGPGGDPGEQTAAQAAQGAVSSNSRASA